MNVIEANISPFIPQQFPTLYQKDDPKFINFVQTFYQYLEETGNPLYYSRNFPILDDVDLTTQNILTFIKQKYFINIQLSTEANIRQIVKHCLDIYRSKGTQRCIELLFRLVFDEVVDFYYPKDDLMKLSSGNWYVPKYIELSLNHNNTLLFHKKIQGLISGATAFVDAIVRTVVNNRYISLAYISAIEGQFVTGEIIYPTDNSLDISQCPTMIGSLTDVTISAQGSGLGFSIGDLVNINSMYGQGAVGLVSGIVDTIGELSYNFLDGGYAYSNSTFAHIANAHLKLEITSLPNTYARRYLAPYETISQPLGEINFSNAVWTGNTILPANGVPASNVITPFAVGNYIATSNDGSTLALIVNSSSTLNAISNTYYGTIFISPSNGVCSADPVYEVNVASNGVLFPVAIANHTPLSNGYTDVTAMGKFIGISNLAIGIISNTDAFTPGEIIIQNNLLYTSDPTILGQATFLGLSSNQEMILGNITGILREGLITGVSSKATANINYILLTVGVINTNNNFIEFSPSPNVSSPSLNAIMVNLFNVGEGASLTFSNSLSFPSTYNYNTDQLSGYLSTKLNATTYGFPANTSANLSWELANAFSYTDIEIGSLVSFTVSPGTGYQFAPIIYIDDYRTAYHNVFDVTLNVTNTSQFFVGLEVSQVSSNALGKIINIDTIRNTIDIRDYRFNDNTQFIVTVDANSMLVEEATKVSTNVIAVASNRDIPAQGRNANVITTVATGNGSLLDLNVLYSGFGYIDGEQIWVDVDNIQGDNTAFGVTNLGLIGKGEGFYRDKNGFLSDTKKLYDGFYYQTFSYEIQSSTVLDKYEKLIKQLAHPSGTMMFGRIVHKTKVNSNPTILTAIMSKGPVLSADPTPYILTFYPDGFVDGGMSITANGAAQVLYGRVLTAGGAAINLTTGNATLVVTT
jgi:hypothetical protein